MTNFKFIDSFQVTSGSLVLGDPLSDGPAVIEDVANGEWYAEIVPSDCGRFNAELLVYLAEDQEREMREEPELIDDLCVDSGTMSVFCKSAHDEDGWLGDVEMLQNMLDNDDSAGGAPGGVACTSGFGDGSYFASVVRDVNGQAVSVCVYFMEVQDTDDEQDANVFNIRDLCIQELN